MNDYGCSKDIPETDDRQSKWAEQRTTRGFDDTETWSLYTATARFLAPRLERFGELTIGHPMELTMEQWEEIVKKMAYSFKVIGDDTTDWEFNNQDKEAVEEGIELFHKYFFHLWW